jgi:hypothetical protein
MMDLPAAVTLDHLPHLHTCSCSGRGLKTDLNSGGPSLHVAGAVPVLKLPPLLPVPGALEELRLRTAAIVALPNLCLLVGSF